MPCGGTAPSAPLHDPALARSLAEFIRELVVAGTRESLAAVRARGKVDGRPTVVDEDLIRASRLFSRPKTSAARSLL
ncbi:hypothetical protein ACFT9I_01470 [Streptomyces sp. NPDC057137]|uniref:hypothetical protein n=1 Tax=Streptomyces sp. NPDC057137 TaxID=3346030 RepID=UPI00363097A8